MSTTRMPNTLIDPQEALSSYLDALLDNTISNDRGEQKVLDSFSVDCNHAPMHGGGERLPLTKSLGHTDLISTQNHRHKANDCADDFLKYYMFKVRGVALALPLEKVNGVLDWPGELPIRSGRQAWMMGYVDCWGLMTKIVDMAELVLPDMSSRNLSAENSTQYDKIVLINEGNWGLACNGGEILNISPGDVRWRTAQTLRPWLAGTNIKRRCALLDTGELVKLLGSKVVAH